MLMTVLEARKVTPRKKKLRWMDRGKKISHLGTGKHTVFRGKPKMPFWARDREFVWKIRKERLKPGTDLCQVENGVLNILEAH